MKLVHSGYGIVLELKENCVQELLVESPSILSKIVEELKQQCLADEGDFVLSENNKVVPFKKKVSFFLEPFSLDCNNKALLTKLYQKIEVEQCNNSQEPWGGFCQSFVEYMDWVSQTMEVPITYDEMIGFQDVLKLGKVKVDTEAATLLERILEYMLLEQRLLGTEVFIFLNLKMFLSTEELRKLYYESFCKKINVILLESVCRERLEEEQSCIIDKDNCVIYI